LLSPVRPVRSLVTSQCFKRFHYNRVKRPFYSSKTDKGLLSKPHLEAPPISMTPSHCAHNTRWPRCDAVLIDPASTSPFLPLFSCVLQLTPSAFFHFYAFRYFRCFLSSRAMPDMLSTFGKKSCPSIPLFLDVQIFFSFLSFPVLFFPISSPPEQFPIVPPGSFVYCMERPQLVRPPLSYFPLLPPNSPFSRALLSAKGQSLICRASSASH